MGWMFAQDVRLGSAHSGTGVTASLLVAIAAPQKEAFLNCVDCCE